MKQAVLSLIVVLVVLACNPAKPGTSLPVSTDTPTANTSTTVATETPQPVTPSVRVTETPELVDPGFNILVDSEGEVQLRRSTWIGYHPTTFGTILRRGDLLQLPRGAQATVLCDGLSVWNVPAGAPAGLTNGCPQPSDKILASGSAGIAGVTRGANDATIPYIISPRSTQLLSRTPLLRWNDSGAASYNIQIRGGDLMWEQNDVTQTELTYPGESALEPGAFYLLVVEDSNGNSSQDEGRVGLGFSILPEDEAEQVRTYENRITGLNLSSEAETYSTAQLYIKEGLVAEAIQILETMVEQGSQQATVHQSLADLYAQIGLLLLAGPRYKEALELAEAQANVEVIAALQAGLGNLYVGLGNEDQAIQWLTQALTGYEALGDVEAVNAVRRKLEMLE